MTGGYQVFCWEGFKASTLASTESLSLVGRASVAKRSAARRALEKRQNSTNGTSLGACVDTAVAGLAIAGAGMFGFSLTLNPYANLTLPQVRPLVLLAYGLGSSSMQWVLASVSSLIWSLLARTRSGSFLLASQATAHLFALVVSTTSQAMALAHRSTQKPNKRRNSLQRAAQAVISKHNSGSGSGCRTMTMFRIVL